jgi:hypothetical protein
MHIAVRNTCDHKDMLLKYPTNSTLAAAPGNFDADNASADGIRGAPATSAPPGIPDEAAASADNASADGIPGINGGRTLCLRSCASFEHANHCASNEPVVVSAAGGPAYQLELWCNDVHYQAVACIHGIVLSPKARTSAGFKNGNWVHAREITRPVIEDAD